MTLRIEAGWNFSVLGTTSISVAESGGGTATASFSSGKYAHTDIKSLMGGTDYDDFAGALQSALNTSSSTPRTYTVTWNATTMAYSISTSTGTVALTFTGTPGTNMRRILGFSGNVAATALATSDVRPYYVISAAVGAASKTAGDYEADGFAEDAYTEGGLHFGIAAGTFPVFNDFQIPLETKAATKSIAATAAVPWTYQHFFQHVRNVEPFLVADGTLNTVHRLRADSARFAPIQESADFDDYWNLDLKTVVVGRL